MNLNNKISILLLACGLATALTAEAQSASARLTADPTPPPVRTLSIRNGALSGADKATMPSRDIAYDANGITVTYTINNSRMARKSLSEAVTFSIDPSKFNHYNCSVKRNDFSIEVSSTDKCALVTFYDVKTGKIEQYMEVDSMKFETNTPENVIVTLQKEDCPIYISHGENTNDKF